MRGVSRFHREHGRWSIYFTPHGANDPIAARFDEWKCDGVLARIRSAELAEEISRLGVPVVELCGLFLQYGFPLLGPDNKAVGQSGAGHLLERGFSHFGFVGMRGQNFKYMDQRGVEFAKAVRRAGFECRIFEDLKNPGRKRERGDLWKLKQERLADWVRSLPKPLGVMACDDEQGMAILQACRHARLRVPDDVAVLGVNNDEYLCEMSIPPLTSIDVNASRIGFQAAMVLDQMMSGRPAPKKPKLFPPREIITRQSTDIIATEDESVARAVAFIRENACKSIRVDDILRSVKLSRASLEPRFKMTVGRTIHQEIQRVQVDMAKKLLTTTDLPLKQIAVRTGFKYAQYMSRVFSKANGCPPARYRKEMRK
ncbi:MAG: DNA-binding transcriptional regulator [Pirellulales bacterium]|nr:DNA-binding transcriptional regulator [Pirellulales bacterium]